MHVQAQQAIKAAKGFKAWGRFAAQRFVKNKNVPGKLVRIARQLEAVK